MIEITSKKAVFLAVIFFFKLCLASPSNNPIDCSSWSGKEWDDYIDSYVLAHDEYMTAKKVRDLQNLLKTCPDQVKLHQINDCTSRIICYYDHFQTEYNLGKNRTDRTYTRQMTNDQYLARQPEKYMQLPDELKRLLFVDVGDKWKEIANRKGWKWVHFTSALGGQERIIIINKQKTHTQLILYYRIPEESHFFRRIQMQSIVRATPDSGRRKTQVHFREWSFPKGYPEVERKHPRGGRCIQCHVNGPRKIYPVPQTQFEVSPGDTLDAINDLILVHGPIDTTPFYNQECFPIFLNVGKSDRAKCNRCHDGVKRTSLSHFVDRDGNFRNFSTSITYDKSMPPYPHNNLTAKQRVDLVRDIQREYEVELKRWLTERKCMPTPHEENQGVRSNL